MVVSNSKTSGRIAPEQTQWHFLQGHSPGIGVDDSEPELDLLQQQLIVFSATVDVHPHEPIKHRIGQVRIVKTSSKRKIELIMASSGLKTHEAILMSESGFGKHRFFDDSRSVPQPLRRVCCFLSGLPGFDWAKRFRRSKNLFNI